VKDQDGPDLQWVGADLHVHTPASRDYKGSREKSEYSAIIKRANEFGASSENKAQKEKREPNRNPIQCIAFTDHNSVEGFRALRNIQEEIENFSKLIRERDPSNPLLAELEQDRQTMHSCRVFMGVEMKADPGIHLLIIFAESVEPDSVVAFLEQAYAAQYSNFCGDPKPTANWTIKDTLDRVNEKFQDSAFVIFPHVDSTGGVYEDLKDFPQVRIAALTHPIVRALSFNKLETRERLAELFRQPDFHRSAPVAFIQTSDFHGEVGTAIGQPRTEVNVREGKPTFKNLREAFRERRVKCSVDFAHEEYVQLTEGMWVSRFTSRAEELGFRASDFDSVAESVCAMLNSDTGIIELEGTTGASTPDESLSGAIRDELISILEKRLEPAFAPTTFRVFRMSPARARVLFRIKASRKLHTVAGKVYLAKRGDRRVAQSHEIEALASAKVATRFGKRFEDTLGKISSESKFLSRLPTAIPVLLANQTKIVEGLPESIRVSQGPSPSTGNREAYDLVEDIEQRQRELYPFGNPKGNSIIISIGDSFRHKDHYARLTMFRGQVPSDILEKNSWPMIETPTIAVNFSGSVGLIDPGFLLCNSPTLLLKLSEEWREDVLAFLAWIKSSFFIWFCAVCHGEDNPFLTLQFHKSRIPVPNRAETSFISTIGKMAKELIEQENQFMDEINRVKKKGDLDAAYLEKLRSRHNTAANAQCLRIDHEIFEFLEIPKKIQKSIGWTLRDLNMTDFGLLQQLDSE
jgi:hypothetical protein